MSNLEYVFRPIQKWPREFKRNRRRAPFKAMYGRTLMDLERELRHLGVTQCIIQAACGDEDIRIDGRLRSSAKLQHPGIIVAFQSKHGWMSYPCDTYADWTDNLRAVTLALTALRAVDRYGVTGRAEQYKGWKALPGGEPAPEGGGGIQASEWATAEEAVRFLGDVAFGGAVPTNDAAKFLTDPEALRTLYREAARMAHPDRNGSSGERMAKVNRARDFIEQHAGVPA